MDGQEYNSLFQFLQEKVYPSRYTINDKRALRKKAENFIIKNHKLYYKVNAKQETTNDQNLRLVVPNDEKIRIISSCHADNGAHLGVDKTVAKISERYYWRGIYRDVRDYTKTCESCQKTNKKQKTTKPEMEPITVPPSTWKKIAIDLIGPYNDDDGNPLSDAGYRYVLTVIDFFSNYTEAFPLFTKNASEIADKLFILFCRHGIPLEMISDNGGEFNSKLSGVIYDMYGYKHLKITPYNPQANGKCERFNQTLKNMLNKTVNDECHNWERFIPKCLFAYNSSKHASTKHSPFYLMFWRNPILPDEQCIGDTPNTFEPYIELNEKDIKECADKMHKIQSMISDKVMENVQKSQKRQKEHFDKRHNINKIDEFKENDVVLVKNKKRKKGLNKDNWLGPYKVETVIKKGTFKISDINSDTIIGTYKQMNIKKYHDSNQQKTASGESDLCFVDVHDKKESASSSNHPSQGVPMESIQAEIDDVVDTNNNSTMQLNESLGTLDDSIFITQNSYLEIPNDVQFDIVQEFIEQDKANEEKVVETVSKRPKRARKERRQSSIYEYFK